MKNFKELNEVQMSSVIGGSGTIMGRGYDSGGYYVIVDNGASCSKEYVNDHPGLNHPH